MFQGFLSVCLVSSKPLSILSIYLNKRPCTRYPKRVRKYKWYFVQFDKSEDEGLSSAPSSIASAQLSLFFFQLIFLPKSFLFLEPERLCVCVRARADEEWRRNPLRCSCASCWSHCSGPRWHLLRRYVFLVSRSLIQFLRHFSQSVRRVWVSFHFESGSPVWWLVFFHPLQWECFFLGEVARVIKKNDNGPERLLFITGGTSGSFQIAVWDKIRWIDWSRVQMVKDCTRRKQKWSRLLSKNKKTKQPQP